MLLDLVRGSLSEAALLSVQSLGTSEPPLEPTCAQEVQQVSRGRAGRERTAIMRTSELGSFDVVMRRGRSSSVKTNGPIWLVEGRHQRGQKRESWEHSLDLSKQLDPIPAKLIIPSGRQPSSVVHQPTPHISRIPPSLVSQLTHPAYSPSPAPSSHPSYSPQYS